MAHRRRRRPVGAARDRDVNAGLRIDLRAVINDRALPTTTPLVSKTANLRLRAQQRLGKSSGARTNVLLTLCICSASVFVISATTLAYCGWLVSSANSSATSVARSNSSGGSCRVTFPLLP